MYSLSRELFQVLSLLDSKPKKFKHFFKLSLLMQFLLLYRGVVFNVQSLYCGAWNKSFRKRDGRFALKSIVVIFFSVCTWRHSAPSVNAIECTDVQICSSDFVLLNSEEMFSVQSFLMSFQRKLLAIYLHHDESVLTNVFCSQMLCAESIVSYLSQNFITWAWDMTKEANRAR